MWLVQQLQTTNDYSLPSHFGIEAGYYVAMRVSRVRVNIWSEIKTKPENESFHAQCPYIIAFAEIFSAIRQIIEGSEPV